MRKLIVIPIIHAPADMGTLAVSLSDSTSAALGQELWAEHQKTIGLFWKVIAQLFQNEAVKVTKIYQDGLVVEGEEGLKIIEAGVKQGSLNYQIIMSLIQKEAILVKTEDVSLVQKEYNYIKKLIGAKTKRERETAALRYKLAQHKLLSDRDNFIARTIDTTLTEGERGVLFIGAYHQVLDKLPPDTQIVQAKKASLVLEYHMLLSNINNKNRDRFQQLAEYLVSPIILTEQEIE